MGTPVRSCAGCRARRPKGDLLRFVRSPGSATAEGVVLDPDQRAPGRGAYACPTRQCVDRALGRGSLYRTLHVAGTTESAERLAESAVQYLRERESPEPPAP